VSKPGQAFFLEEDDDVRLFVRLIEMDQKLFEFRNRLSRDDDQPFAALDQVVVGEDDGGPFIAVEKNLPFHHVEKRADRGLHHVPSSHNRPELFPDLVLKRHGRDIRATANGDGDIPNLASGVVLAVK